MSDLSDMIARGMELSVMCSEDYPFMNLGADYSDTILGNIMLEGIRAQCEVWPRGEVPEGFHDAVRSDVPVLLLSGERDPVTPPHYAAQAAEAYRQPPEPGGPGPVAFGAAPGAACRKWPPRLSRPAAWRGWTPAAWRPSSPSPFFTSLLGPEPMIEVRNLSKSFGKVKAVQRHFLSHERRRDHRPAGAQRRRQNHYPAHAVFTAAARCRRDPHRRAGPHHAMPWPSSAPWAWCPTAAGCTSA